MSWQVRMQADDFFSAYQALGRANLAVMSPGVVCLAFSLELYFKDIYYALNRKPPRSHRILELYKNLPRHIKRKIFFHDSISGNPFAIEGPTWLVKRFRGTSRSYYGFIKRIEEINEAFQQWRYPYDAKRAALKYEEWFVLALIEAVKSVADATRTCRAV